MSVSRTRAILILFKSHGFTDSQISTIVTDYPLLLIEDADKSLGPKLQFLQSRGAYCAYFKSSKNLRYSRGQNHKQLLRFRLRGYRSRQEEFQARNFYLPQGNKLRNVSLLRDLGVPQKRLLGASYSFVYGKERFQVSLNKVLERGFDPTSSKFLGALRFVYGWKEEKIQEKVNVYKRLGFGVEDVWEMLKMWPLSLTHSEKKISQTFETLQNCGLLEDEICSLSVQEFSTVCIGLSADTVKKKTEFVVNEMNWSLNAVVSNPSVLGYNLEKRTVPRCNVIRTLMSKGLLGNKLPPVSPVLAITDEAFLNKYVRKHDDKELVAELMPIFSLERRDNPNPEKGQKCHVMFSA
ncbi:BnaC04g19840D [Brassica napus]|uniref:Mitochondrial transcription termination factor family protein n=2 Tax=Brassica TaxID=3705 RepID=A0A0D3BVS9_BRAOL|nr:unnamed protein product [Brassica napus]CDY08675.1 BnaC04g19840D [Brassica napus]